jgi:hypothetical protein
MTDNAIRTFTVSDDKQIVVGDRTYEAGETFNVATSLASNADLVRESEVWLRHGWVTEVTNKA